MKRMALQIGIILLLFEPIRCVRALLVARGDVARDGFAFGSRLGAFQDDEFAGHGYSLGSLTVSSSSFSAGSSSVRPKSEVTGTRARVTLPCFSIWDWHSTV